MIFEALREQNDPGLPRLSPERLTAGGAVDVPLRRRDPKPMQALDLCLRCFWVSVFAALVFGLIFG